MLCIKCVHKITKKIKEIQRKLRKNANFKTSFLKLLYICGVNFKLQEGER